MYTLGIETSCDETSCSILKGYRVISNVTLSSLREHKPYGGVIPEIATRAHLANIDKTLALALKNAGIPLTKVSLIAATHKPGLIGALVVGLNFAKALAFSLRKPFIAVDHLHAHVFAAFLDNAAPVRFPFLGVVVSGGHTEFYKVSDFDKIMLVGQTKDDAAGEAYDKVAYAYGLGYPGGPLIDKLFDPAEKKAYQFRCGRDKFDVSFSGIKTALMYKKIELERSGLLNKQTTIKVMSSFQEAVVQTLKRAILDAASALRMRKVVCGGGVIANRYLRQELLSHERKDLQILIPPPAYTSDNGAIVAGLGFYLYNKKRMISPLSITAEAN